MTVEKLRKEYINNVPVMRMSKILQMMNQIDAPFTKTFLESNLNELKNVTK